MTPFRPSELTRLGDIVAAAVRRYPFPFVPGQAPLEGLEAFRAEFSPRVCASLLDEIQALTNQIHQLKEVKWDDGDHG